MRLNVEISGDQEVIKRLKRTADGILDLRAPLKEATTYLKRYYAGVSFASRGSVFGERWPRLNPAYEVQKLKKWGSRPMLVASGKMQAGFDDEVKLQSARVFNPVPYFKYHQTGTNRMPKRAMIGVNDTIEREVNRIVNDAIRRDIQATL